MTSARIRGKLDVFDFMNRRPGLIYNLRGFIVFFYCYSKSRLIFFGITFEKAKDLLVSLLIVKRGKYSQSFLNTSFFLLVFTVLLGGSSIAESNPLVARYFSANEQSGNIVLASDIENMPFETTVSQKPRDTVIQYMVVEGDTLSSLAQKFDVSVDTIKWANDLKIETIKEGQVLKIPPVTGVVHKVVSGETIYSIAKKYKTETQSIVNFPFNDFTDLDTFALNVGQTLYVPDGVIEEEKPVIRPRLTPQVVAGAPGTGNFIWPTSGSISQYPVWYHNALDIANASAPPIIAADSGTVVYADCVRYGYGCYIIIDHNNGYRSLYAHLSEIYVSTEAGKNTVGQGQTIGKMGSTGRSTGTHLHFEIRAGDKILNPLGFLK